MSIPRFERDDQEEIPGPRRAGRVVPVRSEPTVIDIIVNGVVFGVVEPMQLKAKAQIDLERVRGALDLLRWCEQHANVSSEDMPTLEAELGEMPLMAIVDLATLISAALGEAMQIPKPSGRR